MEGALNLSVGSLCIYGLRAFHQSLESRIDYDMQWYIQVIVSISIKI